MSHTLRWLLALGAGAAALAAVLLTRDRLSRGPARPAGAAAAGPDGGEARRAVELGEAVSRLQGRLRAREELARGLIEGRVTLEEAAARRRALMAVGPAGATEEAVLDALLIDAAYALRAEPPEREGAALARLRAAVRRRLAALAKAPRQGGGPAGPGPP